MKKYLTLYISILLCVMGFASDAMAQSISLTPYAFEVTGSSGGYGGEEAANVVDGNADTKWCYNRASYQRIEYLENTGNVKTYFQTNYRPVANTVIEIKYQTSSDALNDNQWRSLFAARTASNNGFSFYVNNNTTEKKYGYFVGGYVNDYCGVVDDGVHTAICSLGSLKIDGVDVVATGRTEYNASDRNLAIFGNPGIDESFKGRIYYVKVYEGDRLMKYYVPVKDGESFAFFDLMHGDKVEKTGDGAFTAGPDLEASATQHFVTFLASDAKPCSIEGFSLTTAGDTETYWGRNPVSWTLYGGADGSSWEPIEHFDQTMPAANKATKYFKLSKPSNQYKYYQLMITSLRSGGLLQLSEITLTPCLWPTHSNHNMWRKVDENPNVWTWSPDGSGIEINVDHANGSSIYDATITNANDVQWNNQFGITAADFPLKQSMKYNVYCVLQSDQNINGITMKLLENGDSDDDVVNANFLFEQAANVNVEANKTFVFKASNVQLPIRDVAGVRLIFDLKGAPSPTQFRVADIYMEPAFAPDWDYNDPRNAWKEVDRKSTSYTAHAGKVSDTEHLYDSKVWEYDITEATTDQWQSWVQIHSGYPVKKSSNYCFYVAVMADKDVTNATIKLENKGDGEHYLLSQSGINLQAGVPYYFKKDFATSNADFDDLSFVMDFDGAEANTHVVVSDIYLSELEDWDVNSADNKWKTATTQNGDSWGVGTPSYDADHNEWSATIENDLDAGWAAGIKIKSDISISTDKIYDCYMSIVVDKDVEKARIKVESSAAGGGGNYIFEEGPDIALKAYTPYIFKIADKTPNSNFDNAQVTVAFDKATAGTKVTIKDIFVSEDKEVDITNGTKIVLMAEAADGTPLGYLDRNFQPSPDGIPFMLEKDGGNTYLRNQDGRLSYFLLSNAFRNGSNQYYQRDDLGQVFAQAQLQYYNNSTLANEDLRKYPQLRVENGETNAEWNSTGTWVHNADLNITGSYSNYARRYVQLKFYESGKVRFILKDNNLQDNSRPMDPTNGNRTLLSEFYGKGTTWDEAFYMTVATGYPHNDTSAESQVIYPTTDPTKAIKLYFEEPVTLFVPYEGDTYSGVVGTDIPSNLLYNGEAFKSHADDGRILPETGPIQRTHENEREVWVFPGVDYELLPYSDFKTAGQYEETYNRWYDYATGKKSEHVVPVERDVVDIEDGIFGGLELTGKRVNGTSMIYRVNAGDVINNNIWLASPAMTHSYTPGHVTFDDRVYQMSDVSGATVMKLTGGDPGDDASWTADGTASKDGDKITVNFTGGADETKRVFIDPGYNGYENSVDYKLHIKVKASRAMSNVELYPLEKKYPVTGGFEKTPERFDLAAGEEKDLFYDFSEGINARGSRIWLDNITAKAGDQLEISDVYILKGTPPTSKPLKILQENNSYKFSLDETDGRWRAMVLFDEVELNINNNSDYTFKFNIKSSSALKRTTHLTNELDNGGIFVKLEDCGNPGNFLFAGIVEISDEDAGKEVEKVITIPRGGDHITIDGTNYPKVVAEGVSASVLEPGGIQKCKVIFDFGSNPATDVEISNIVLMDQTESTNAELLDIIAMDASCSFTTADNINFSGVTQTITEPNVHFRSIFVVKNARVRADILSDKTKGQAYVAEHKEKLLAPVGTPFQYRLTSGEHWDFPTGYVTDYWYKKANTGNVNEDYDAVHHYLIETWKKDGSGVYQLLGKTINDKDGGDTQFTPGNVADLARLYKSNNYVDRVFYIQNPTVGDYQIRFYAIENNLGSGTGVDRAQPIYYYGESHTPDNRMLLMEYDLTVLPPKEGNMILESELYGNDDYAHQRPDEMTAAFVKPTTVVNFDELDPARLQLDANGNGYYKWPRKWEESSYAFGYDKRHDYNMYVVANHANVTPYHAAVDETHEFYDILYKESGGAKKGFFYYTNAAGDPGRMTVLNIGDEFCATSTVYVSAWVMEFSKVGETANVVFSFKGVDANGGETTLSSFVTGYITGGDNRLSDGTNPDNRGKWHHVYYSFHPEIPAGKKFDHYIISVENNCVNSGGADYAIDDIRAYVVKPSVTARQRVPICNGDNTTKLVLTARYNQMKEAFNFEDTDEEVSFYYCFVDSLKYKEGIKEINMYSDASDRANLRLQSFNNALVKNAYGPDHATYGVLRFKGDFDANAEYDIDPDDIILDPSNPDPLINVARKYTHPVTGERMLVFPSFANDNDMKVGKTYIVAMVMATTGDPTPSDFDIDEACSSTSTFTVMTSGQVKVDGELVSAENGANVCANQLPVITIDMTGIGNIGDLQKTEQAYFDWYYGALDGMEGSTDTEYSKAKPDAVVNSHEECDPRFTWATDDAGNVVITISEGEGNAGGTKFRGTGMNGTFSLNGNDADFATYFNRGKTDDYTYKLTLKNPYNRPANGSRISYQGQIECMSSIHNNDWSDYKFDGYTYSICESFDYAAYGGTTLKDALGYFRYYYPKAGEEDFKDKDTKCPLQGSYTQVHYDCIMHYLNEKKIALYHNSEVLSTYDQYQEVLPPGADKHYYITALPINPTPDSDVLKYCLEPFQVVINLNTRTPRMKNGDDSGLIPYPEDMRDVPLRIGLRQLDKVRMNGLGDTNPAHFLYMPLRDVRPATVGVKSLIQKDKDDFVYLVASNDPNVAAGLAGGVNVEEAVSSGVKIIGKVSDITAYPDRTGNVCHLNFIRDFQFREGYEYTIKFKFEENYSGVINDHSDVCPGDVVCTIKVVPEYQMWTGAVDSNWNNDGNWKRVSSEDLLTEIAGTTYDENWNNASPTYETYLAPNWAVDANSTSDYNTSTGVLNIHIAGGAKDRWQGQLQLNSHASLDADKEYTFSCDIVSTKDINNMCFQFNMNEAPVIEPISLTANTPYHFVVEHCVPIPSSGGVMVFDTGVTDDEIDIQFSNFSIVYKARGSSDYYTDGSSNDNTSSYVPADFTKVVIPANVPNVPKLHDLRTAANLVSVHFAGAHANSNYIQNMADNRMPVIGDATDLINFDMSSIDLTEGADNDNVACRAWYDHTCQYIHFNSEAQMLSQQFLNYEKAWADFEMEPNKWTTVSSPLINVVAGDLYLPTDGARQETPLFEDVTFDPALHDRFHPAVFQRSWNARDAKVVHLNGDDTNSAVELDWSRVYNDVNVNYSAGVGFSIKPDVSMMAVKPAKVKFRLPKGDTNYHYWNPNHQDGNVKNEDVQAPMTDGQRTHRLADFTSTTFHQMVGQDGATSTKYFLVGNPMMCYLDMNRFFNANPQLERKYWIVTGKGQQYAAMDEDTEGYVGTVENTYVKPFQSFFVAMSSGSGATFTPTFNSSMMVVAESNATNAGYNYIGVEESPVNQQPGDAPDPATRAAAGKYVMSISASDNAGNVTTAMLTDAQERSISSVEALFDKNLYDRPMVYTNVKGEAMSLSQIAPGDTIPLALTGVRGDVELTLHGADSFSSQLYLMDTQNGEVQPINGDMTISQSANGVRYYILADPTGIDDVRTGMPEVIVKDGVLTVKAPAGSELDYICIYKVDGATMAKQKNAGQEFSIQLPTNVYLIDAVCDGAKYTFKIAVR